MVRCLFFYKGGIPYGFEAKGHANAGPYGSDLVCAAVSAITIGGINALEGTDRFQYLLEEGHAKVIFQKEPSLKDIHVLETLECQLESLAESYPDKVRLERKKEA